MKVRNHFHTPAAKVLRSSIDRTAHPAELDVTLAAPGLNSEANAEVMVTVLHGGRVLTRAHAGIPVGISRCAVVELPLAKSIPAGAVAQFDVITEVGGTAPSTARTKRTLTLRR